MRMPPLIRLASVADLPAINDIYNHYVLRSTTSYQLVPDSIEERSAWFAARGPQHPVTVAERDGLIVGWGALSRYHARAAYAHTVEDSIYVHHEHHRTGVGSALLADLMERARDLGHHTIIAAIDAEQAPSITLHARFGFAQVGYMRELGRKFERWLDVVYMQRMV